MARRAAQTSNNTSTENEQAAEPDVPDKVAYMVADDIPADGDGATTFSTTEVWRCAHHHLEDIAHKDLKQTGEEAAMDKMIPRIFSEMKNKRRRCMQSDQTLREPFPTIFGPPTEADVELAPEPDRTSIERLLEADRDILRFIFDMFEEDVTLLVQYCENPVYNLCQESKCFIGYAMKVLYLYSGSDRIRNLMTQITNLDAEETVYLYGRLFEEDLFEAE